MTRLAQLCLLVLLLLATPLVGCSDPSPRGSRGGVVDSGASESDAGATADEDSSRPRPPATDGAVGPPPPLDAGPPPPASACTLVSETEIAALDQACGTTSLAVDGRGDAHVAWMFGSPIRTAYAVESGDGTFTQQLDPFGTGVQRLALAADHDGQPSAVVELEHGAMSLWTGPSWRERQAIDGIHVIPWGRGLAFAGATLHGFAQVTDSSTGTYLWGPEHLVGAADRIALERLALGRSFNAIDMHVTADGSTGLAYFLYHLDGTDYLAAPPRAPAPLPRWFEIAEASSLIATAGETVYLLGREPIEESPGMTRTIIATPAPDGGMVSTPIATSMESVCRRNPAVREGTTCDAGALLYGPRGGIASSTDASSHAPVVVLLRVQESGTLIWDCSTGPTPRCVPCSWTGDVARSATIVAGPVESGTTTLGEVAGLTVAPDAALELAMAADGIVHLVIVENTVAGGTATTCRMRHATLRCSATVER